MFDRLELNKKYEKNNKQGVFLTQPCSTTESFILNAATLMHVCAIAEHFINFYSKPEEEDSLTWYTLGCALLYGVCIGLVIYGRHQTKQQHEFHFFNAKEEVNRSRLAIKDKGDSDYNVTLYGHFFDSDEYNGKRLYFTFVDEGNQKKLFNVWWDVGNTQLLNQAKRVEAIFKQLPHLKFNHSTKALSEWRKFLPAINGIIDSPSKARIYIFINSLFKAVVILEQLLISNPTVVIPLTWFEILVALLIIGLQLAENYTVNDKKIQYQLEGYGELFPSYCGKYPTCIGQQISTDFVLMPSSTLKQTIKYLTAGYEKLTELGREKYILPEKIIREIELFMAFYTEHFVMKQSFIAPQSMRMHG